MQFWKKESSAKEEQRPPTLRSREMEEAVTLWEDVFRGRPPWRWGKRSQTMNLAACTTQYLARLVCAELHVEAGPSSRGKRLARELEEQALPLLPAAVQQAMAGGCAVLKPWVQEGHLRVEWLRADQFYPTEMDGSTVRGAVFLEERSWKGRDYLRMERHSFGEDGVYRITQQVRQKPGGRLCQPEEWSLIPGWEGLEEIIEIEGLEGPLFALWQMPFANTVDGSDQPVSLYANALDTLRDLDRLYGDFTYEFATARRKMILREDALELRPDGSPILPPSEGGADVYLPMDLPGEGQPFGDYTPQIRQEAYEKGMNHLLRIYEMQTGVSPGTFSLDGSRGAVTATQVISEDRKTYYTVREIQNQGQAALRQLARAMDALLTLYGLEEEGEWKLSADFGDSVFEDTATELQRRIQLVGLGLKPELVVAWYFGKTEEEAAAMMAPVSRKETEHGTNRTSEGAADGGTAESGAGVGAGAGR